MDNIQHLRAFVAAVETGSLSAASRRLDVTQSAISQNLSALEKNLNTTLLVRSRSGVRATEAGQITLKYAKRVLETMQDMHAALDADRNDISGKLRVTATLLLSQTAMTRVIARLHQTHPKLHIKLIATDEMTDLVEDQIDFAMRFGRPGEGQGIVRRIGSLGGVLVATPAYLDQVGRPKGPEELINLSYIQYHEDPEEREMSLLNSSGSLLAPVRPSFSAHHPNLVLHALENGLGFAKAPLFYIGNSLRRGVLEEVLPGYVPTPKPIYLLQAEHIRNTPKAQVFLTTFLEELVKLEGVKLTPDLAPENCPEISVEKPTAFRRIV